MAQPYGFVELKKERDPCGRPGLGATHWKLKKGQCLLNEVGTGKLIGMAYPRPRA